MGLRAWNLAVLAAAFGAWFAAGTQSAQPVLANGAESAEVRALETKVAQQPTDEASVLALAQTYMTNHAPGMAVSVIESSPEAVRNAPKVSHLYARALVDQGRNADALAAERHALASCTDFGSDAATARGCDMALMTSATHRADILQELVNDGVEDSQAQPDEAAIAYYTATREVRIAVATK
jgi:predicted Zn-dependent protease